MSGVALGIVLFAALLHAGWNALVRAVTDRAAVLAAVSAAHVIVGLGIVLSVPVPSPAAWVFIAISTVMHYVYYTLLFQAYRIGDLSQVYPISRGMAPALVAIAAFLLIGESLPPLGWAGLAAISFGIGMLSIGRGALRGGVAPVLWAVALGAVIGIYSVADGIGIRRAEGALGYIGWLFLLEAPVPLYIAVRRLHLGGRFEARVIALGLFGGVCSLLAYGLVLYVKTIAPLGAVSAVRESSVIIAALIGVLVFGERPVGKRLLAAAIVAGGVIALAASG